MSHGDSCESRPHVNRSGFCSFKGVFQSVLLAAALVSVALLLTGRVSSLFSLERHSIQDVLQESDVFQQDEQRLQFTQEAHHVIALVADNLSGGWKRPAVVKTSGLSTEMILVRDWVSRRYRVSAVALEPALAAAELAGHREGIDPLLIVAVMAVESRFNPFAESQMGAQGLMQVIPRFHMEKIGHAGGEDADDLFDPAINVHVGAKVLREGLLRYGSLNKALQYYAGALNDPAAGYAQKVLNIRQQLMVEAGRGINLAMTARDA